MSSPTPPPPGDPVTADWNAIEADADFRALLKQKAAFVVPATIFFIVYYFTLPILVGWFPEMMSRPVWGDVNAAYLFALSQFAMAWILAGIYVVAAAGWDKKSIAILRKFGRA